MSLVADYDSDSEENDSITEECSDKVTPKDRRLEGKEHMNKEGVLQLIHNEAETIKIFSESSLFSKLPQSKINSQNLTKSEDQIEDFVPKSTIVKGKQKVRISIPSLSDFKKEDLDEPTEKKLKCSSKGSGLLSLLPPIRGTVKTTKSFVPNVVANKNKISTNLQPKQIPKKTEVKKIVNKHTILVKKGQKSVSDAESEDEDIEIPETFDDEMWQKVCGRPKHKPVTKKPEPLITEPIIDIAPEPEKPYDGLDNEAFKELVGKTKRPIGNIKLIDINEEEILSDKDLWMTKSLTDPEMAPKATVEDPVDPTRRKKHHITYLAQQAKANEQELANSWAASKNNRLASRAKYGF